MLLRLNPCFNGIWSRTGPCIELFHTCKVVLILVLMEYGLGLKAIMNDVVTLPERS